MPRPKQGYFNAAGQEVPATGDIVDRFMDGTGLKFWAYNQGKAGLPLYDRAALDVGSVIHGMIERDVVGASDREIEFYMHERLAARMHVEMATASFRQYREWRQQNRIRLIKQETSLVSEKHQYGGTLDLVCIVNNGIGLIDWKSSNECKGPFPDQKVRLAAYANLWNENNPRQRLDDYHLIILPKNGAGFKHCSWGTRDLDTEWKLFLNYRAGYDLDKACTGSAKKRTARAQTKPAEGKPRIRVKARSAPVVTLAEVLLASDLANHVFQPEHQLSMTEILRAYGHVPEVRA
jgi:hypothetical protein